jgi:Phage tail assembly chaperone protein
MNMLTADQLAYLLAREYPALVKCVDYWVGHPVDGKTFQQKAPAFIVKWYRRDIPVPLTDDILKLWDKYGADCIRELSADAARRQRNTLLTDADRVVERAIDTANASDEKAARAYRQALRDVPAQRGFPLEIEWPECPGQQPQGDNDGHESE